MNQPKKTANAELSKTPAATPSHSAQIETLAMANRPCRTAQDHIAPERVDEPLTDLSPSSSSNAASCTPTWPVAAIPLAGPSHAAFAGSADEERHWDHACR